MTFSAPTADLDELFAIAREYGYTGIELRLDSNHRHGVETSLAADQRRAVAKTLSASDITTCALACSCRFADAGANAGQVRIAKDVVDLADDIGVPIVRVFGGKIPDGVTREAAADAVVEALSEIGDHIGQRNVTVCLETHDDWRDPHAVADVIRRVGHERIAINWDVMHPVRAGFPLDEAFTAMKPWIRYVHIHDTTDGDELFAPIGEGIVDHKRVLELLHAHRYDGFLSGEWINWGEHTEYLGREIEAMRKYEAELGIA